MVVVNLKIKNLKNIKKDLKKYDKENKYYKVPKNWKRTLRRKLYKWIIGWIGKFIF